MAVAVHRRSRGERRRRAVVTLRSIAGGARRSIYGPLALILILGGGVFWVLPRISAAIAAVICTWLALAAVLEVLGRRRP
jgi:hypothetical protein